MPLEAAEVLTRATVDISDLERGMNRAKGLVDGFASGVHKMGNIALGATAAGVTAIAGGLAAVGVGGIRAAADLEQGMANVQAVLGATNEEVGLLKDLTLDLALDPNLVVSASQSAEMLEILAKNGLNTQQILDGAAESTVLLANATGAQFGTAADIATSAMLVFNKEASELDEVVNSIVGVTNQSKFGIEDYGQAMAQAAGPAAGFGVELEDLNGWITTISTSFSSGSDAGTSLKTMMQRLVPTTGPAVEAMSELGLMTWDTERAMEAASNMGVAYTDDVNQLWPALAEAHAAQRGLTMGTEEQVEAFGDWAQSAGIVHSAFYDANGQMKEGAEVVGLLNEAFADLTEEDRNRLVSKAFGSDAMRAALGLSQYTEEEFRVLLGTLENTDAAAGAATRMDTFSGALEIARGTVEALSIKIGDALLPLVRPMIEEFTEFAGGAGAEFIDTFSTIIETMELSETPLGKASVLISGIAQAMGATPAEAGSIVSNFREFVDIITTFVDEHQPALVGAIEGIGVAFAVAGIAVAIGAILSPMGLLIIAAGLLGAAFAENVGGIADIAGKFTEGFEEGGLAAGAEAAFEEVKLRVGEKIEEFKPIVIQKLQEIGATIYANLPTGFQTFVDDIALAVQRFRDGDLAGALSVFIPEGWANMVSGAVNALGAFVENIGNAITKLQEGKEIWPALKEIFPAEWVDRAHGAADAIGGFVGGITNWIASNPTQVIEEVKGLSAALLVIAGASAAAAVLNNVSGGLNAIGAAFQAHPVLFVLAGLLALEAARRAAPDSLMGRMATKANELMGAVFSLTPVLAPLAGSLLFVASAAKTAAGVGGLSAMWSMVVTLVPWLGSLGVALVAIAPVVVGVGLAALAMYLLWKDNWKLVRDALEEQYDYRIKPVLEAISGNDLPNIEDAVVQFKDTWALNWAQLGTETSALWTGTIQPVLMDIATFLDTALNKWNSFWAMVRGTDLTVPTFNETRTNSGGSFPAGHNTGQHYSQGVEAGIRSGQGSVNGASADLMSGAITSGQDAIQSRSPSRLAYRLLGLPIPQGVIGALWDEAPRVGTAIARTLTDGMAKGQQATGSSLTSWGREISGFVVPTIGADTGSSGQGWANPFGPMLEDMASVGSGAMEGILSILQDRDFIGGVFGLHEDDPLVESLFELRDAYIASGGNIQEAISPLLKAITLGPEFLAEGLDFTLENLGIETFSGTIREQFADLIESFVSGATGSASAMGGTMQGIEAQLANDIGDYMRVISQGGDGLTDYLLRLPADIAPGVEAIGEMIGEGGHHAAAAFRNYLAAMEQDGDYLNDWLTHLPEALRPQVEALGRLLAQNINTSMATVEGATTGTLTTVGLGVTGEEATQQATEHQVAMMEATHDRIAQLTTGIHATIAEARELIEQDAIRLGEAIVFGIVDTINANAYLIAKALTDALNGAVTAGEEAMGIASPARVPGQRLAVPIMQGIALDIRRNAGLVNDALAMALNGAMQPQAVSLPIPATAGGYTPYSSGGNRGATGGNAARPIEVSIGDIIIPPNMSPEQGRGMIEDAVLVAVRRMGVTHGY